MVQELTTQPNMFGRLGKGLAKGLSETVPKEIERNRLVSGLEELGKKKGLTPFQQFSGLVKSAHEYPQIIQSGSDLLRQQAIIDSLSENKKSGIPKYKPVNPAEKEGPTSATTRESTEAALNPYIPPSGQDQEQMARNLMATEPQIYPNIEAARSAISNQVAADVNQSNAKLAKRQLEQSVQNDAEKALQQQLGLLGAQIPGTTLSKLQQDAVDDVRTKKLTPEEAKIIYGKKADEISKDFSNIRSWGGLGLITKDSKDLLNSIRGVQQKAKEGNYQKEAADSLVGENGLTPQFAYASMYPVSDIKSLNDELKALPNIKQTFEKSLGGPGLAGAGVGRPNNANAATLTTEVAPRLAKSMGLEGSPLSIGYELKKKGYDDQIWKKYLLDNQKQLNLTSNQLDELEKPQPSFFGWLNDWWLSAFSGVK